jgi:hypothetical protein
MFKMECRLGYLIFCCLLGVVLTTNTQAQSVRAGESLPASASSPSAPYSPTVSFGYLPALQVATPKPGSPYVANDFNGDGTSDLLWFNPSLSEVGYWTMTATTAGVSFAGGGVTQTGARTFNVTPGYFVGATGDFNNDGYADLIFTSAKRDLWLWTNNHQGGFTSTEIGTYPSQWQLVGAGDIDGDGQDDLLWLDPSDCEFAYWTMQGAVRTGYKIVPVTCGYYPIGIGYYATTNRLSILWTSAAHDLYVWDSTANGFVSTNLGIDMTYIWAVGGGFMGNSMGLEFCQPYDGSDGSNGSCSVYGALYSRTFDARGNQSGFTGEMNWDGGGSSLVGSGGYVIQADGVNATGLYTINQTSSTISTGGLPGSDIIFSGNAPDYTGYDQWTYPAGWYVVGAPVNGTAPLPWH